MRTYQQGGGGNFTRKGQLTSVLGVEIAAHGRHFRVHMGLGVVRLLGAPEGEGTAQGPALAVRGLILLLLLRLVSHLHKSL